MKIGTLQKVLLCCFFSGWAQAQMPNGSIQFGNFISTTQATTANTGFGGMRIGTQGGSFQLVSPGAEIGSNSELQGIAPTGGSINSIAVTSDEFGTSSEYFTISFELSFSGGAGGNWLFFAGNGTTFSSSQSTNFNGNQTFMGLRWTFDAANQINTACRTGGNWVNLSNIFSQHMPYHVTIIGNNSASTVAYGNGEAVGSNTFDLWVNGTKVGDDLGKALLPNSTAINAFRFYGEASPANTATIHLDNVTWWNTCVPPSISSYSTLSVLPSGTYSDVYINQNTSASGQISVGRMLHLVQNTLTSNGNFVLKSNTNGTAQVVGGTNASITGNVTVERFLPWQSANNNGFRFVGHPLRSNPVINTVTNLPTANNTLIGYNEVQNAYAGITNRAGNWPQATAYGVWTDAANTLSFTGELQLNEVGPISLTNSSQRWHYLANPFPSVLDWNAVSRTDLANAVYIWEKDNAAEGSGTWGSFIDGVSSNNGGRYLAPGQGFMVRTNTSGSPAITFPAAARSTASNPSYYRQQNVVGDVFRVRIQKPTNQSGMETVIRFRNQATAAFDDAYDAEFLTDWTPASPDLYTTDAQGNKYSIQALPELGNQTVSVPVSLETFGAGAFTFSFDASGMTTPADIRLQDLRDGSYTQVLPGHSINITSSNQDIAGRFVLHFNASLSTSTPSIEASSLSLYTHEGALYVNGANSGELRITDLTGRTVYHQTQQNFGEAIRPALAKGAYLVQVSSIQGSKFVKVIF